MLDVSETDKSHCLLYLGTFLDGIFPDTGIQDIIQEQYRGWYMSEYSFDHCNPGSRCRSQFTTVIDQYSNAFVMALVRCPVQWRSINLYTEER